MITEEQVLEILNDWNFWEVEPGNFIERGIYGSKIELYRKANEIISLIGIRRCGKSTLLKQEIKSLLKTVKNKQILFINFEDPRFSQDLNTKLLDKIFNTYKNYVNFDKEIYLFLDEIQNVENWENWVRTKYELNQANIYITGSSSKLLSKELGSVLTGRNLNLEIFPLTFKEFLKFNNIFVDKKIDFISKKNKIKQLLEEYLKFGGFPKVVLLPTEIKIDELKNYFYNILQKDIMIRYKIKNFNNLEKLIIYIYSNNTLLYSANNLKNVLKISLESVLNYISYFKESYLIFEVSKFSYSLKKQNYSKKKLYAIDLGLLNCVSFNFSENKGRLLENLVYLELRKKNYNIYYHNENKECDFVLFENNKIIKAIQVTNNLYDEKTRKREILGLIDACKTYNLNKGIIIVKEGENEKFEFEGIKIKVINVLNWMLLE